NGDWARSLAFRRRGPARPSAAPRRPWSARSAQRGGRARSTPLPTGGSARAHARASPPPPRPAPGRRGLGAGHLRLFGSGFRLRRGFGRLEVDGAGLAAVVLLQVVGQALVLAQRVHSGALDRSDVDERVLAAVIGGDEAVALLLVEEFYGSDGHCMFPSGGPEMAGPLLG